MMTLEDEIRDLFLKLFKPRLAFWLAALCLFVVFQGKEFTEAFNLPFKEAVITIFKNVFLLLTFWFASNAIFYLSQLPKLKETLNKAEQILDVQAFYPINYPDLPEEIKYNVRGYVSKSINQICEHGTPLIACSDKEQFVFYKDFAFKANKIYGTATRSPFYYASEPDIQNYIKFFKGRDVTRVTILDKNTIEQIIARNIFHTGAGTHKDKMPEIEWYEKQFNANHKHFWFLQELKSESILTDIHDEQRYTNYAIYLFKKSNKILLNYFERTNNMGFFLLKCIPIDRTFVSSDKIALKINSFIEKLDDPTKNDTFYSNFHEMVKQNIKFADFKVKEITFEYPIGTSVVVKMALLLSNKSLPNSNWDDLFGKLANLYDDEYVSKFPLVI